MEHICSLCSGFWFLQHVIANKRVIFYKLLHLCVMHHIVGFLLKYKLRKLRSCSLKMIILPIFIFILHSNYISSFSKIKPQFLQLMQLVPPFCFTYFGLWVLWWVRSYFRIVMYLAMCLFCYTGTSLENENLITVNTLSS